MTERPPRARSAHPLLGAFPLAIMTLATFLVLITVMMARLRAGADPALRPIVNSGLVARSSGTGALTTRTSGGSASAPAATPPATSEEPPVARAAVVTRASGAQGATRAAMSERPVDHSPARAPRSRGASGAIWAAAAVFLALLALLAAGVAAGRSMGSDVRLIVGAPLLAGLLAGRGRRG